VHGVARNYGGILIKAGFMHPTARCIRKTLMEQITIVHYQKEHEKRVEMK